MSGAEELRADPVFDADWYRARHADVDLLGMDPAEHYLTVGGLLGRDPGPDFDRVAYLAANPDVAASGMDPVLHYLRHGRAEGRPPCPPRADDPAARGRHRVLRWRGEAYVLGVHERALDAWHQLALFGDPVHERGLAAFEMAQWHLRRGADGEARAWLDRALRLPAEADLRRRQVVLHLLCEHRRGASAPSDDWMAFREDRGLIGVDALHARANFAQTAEDRLPWINRALGDHAPVSLADAPTPFDGLTATAAPIEDGPRVTVLLAAYNASATLEAALASLAAQGWRNLEILVIDDASPDDTAKVAERFPDPRVRVLRQGTNGGAYVARNLGLAEATGEFVTLHDADDWAHPERIATQVAYLQAHPDCIACTSRQVRLREDLTVARITGSGNLLAENTASLLFRRDPVMERLGGWDTVRMSADNELIRRMRRAFGAGAVASLPTPALCFQRDHDGSAVADPVLGISGFRFGARKAYHDAQLHHHARAETLRYEGDRPFPAPRILRLGRRGAEHPPFHTLLAADFRDGSALDRLGGIPEGRTGLVEMVSDMGPDAPLEMDPETRRAAAEAHAEIVVYGETAPCATLRLDGAGLLGGPQTAHLPEIRAGLVVVVTDGTGLEDPEALSERSRALFGAAPVWEPVDDEARAALAERGLA